MRASDSFMPSTSSRSKLGTPPMNALIAMLEIGFTPFSACRDSTTPRADVCRLRLVAPDRAVDVHPERDFLLWYDLGDRARRRPEHAVAAVEVVHRRVDVDLCLQQRCCHRVHLGRIQLSPLCAPRDPWRTARRCHRKIDVPSAPTARPATANGRHSCRPGTVNAITVATSQPAVIATMTGQGSSRMAGSAGGSGATITNVADYGDVRNGPVFLQFSRVVLGTLCLCEGRRSPARE
jgi:hypothetical protein